MASPDTVYRPHPRLAYRDLGGRVVIVDLAGNVLLTLNETASAIWGLLDGRSAAEVAAEIAGRFEVDEAAALSDALEHLEELRGRDLLVREDGAGGR